MYSIYYIYSFGGETLFKKVLSIILILITVSLMGVNGLSVKDNRYTEPADTQKGIEFLDKLSSQSIEEAEKSIKKIEDEYNAVYLAAQTEKNVKKSIRRLNAGKTTLRKIFKNVTFAGDSLMAGLEAYDILNSKRIFAQVSASLYHLEENIPLIVKQNPKILVLHYGINMIATDEVYLDIFVKMYTRLIKDLKKQLPDTRIIVSLIFPVDRKIAKAARFGRISAYNKATIKMCKKLKVEYINSSSVLNAHPECYGSDGIHQSQAFYEKHWLKFLMREKGIY